MANVYNSSTLGPIPLSFTGRRHMQNLREEVEALIKLAYENGRRDGLSIEPRFPIHNKDREPLSRARGYLAKYISKLEAENKYHTDSVESRVSPNRTLRATDDNPHPYGKSATVRTDHHTIVLPPIPEGYILEVVGGLIRIVPKE